MDEKWLALYLIISACVIALILIIIIVDLIVTLKRKTNNAAPVAPVIIKEVVEEKVVERASAPAPVVNQNNDENIAFEEGGVKFSTKLSLREKYKSMQPDSRERFDRVEHYLSNVDGIKVVENDRYLEYKFGRTRIARITIKKDIPHCECFVVSKEFSDAVKENRVSVKAAGPIVKIKSDADVDAIRSIVDVNISIYNDEIKNKRKKISA